MKFKKKWFALFYFIFVSLCFAQQDNIPYSVPENVWEEKLGNHRAVINVAESAPAVRLDFLWRRFDKTPDQKRLVIQHAETGEFVENIYRQIITSEQCKLVFGPVQKGTYYFYYLPYYVQKGWGFYNKPYVGPEKGPDKNWVKENIVDSETIEQLPLTTVVAIQSRTKFDSFFPMEIIPTAIEKQKFVEKIQQDFLLFPEDRKFPIRMRDELPLKWVTRPYAQQFIGAANKNEFYVFQVGLYAKTKALENVEVITTELIGPSGYVIPPDKITCFNTEGVGPLGNYFEKKLLVERDKIQALWFGVDLDKGVQAGKYSGQIVVKPSNSLPHVVNIELTINDKMLADRGDGERWRLSRLRWLNSTRGISDEPTPPYTPIETDGNKVMVLGRVLDLAKNLLPEQLTSWNTELLEGPIEFIVQLENGKQDFSFFKELKNNIQKGLVERAIQCENDKFECQVNSIIEFDGYVNYKIQLTAKAETSVEDIRLVIPMKKNVGEYVMGLSSPGRQVQENFNEQWGGPFDSFWIGNTFGGVHCELRGSNYHGPLLNLFHPAPPTSWYNKDKGGLKIEKLESTVLVSAYSGARVLKKGKQLDFEFSMLITPVKQIQSYDQFTNRYYHSGGTPAPTGEDIQNGVRIINVHHANEYNPYINYPFIANKKLRGLVDKMHAQGVKVKLYYTIRELTNHVDEIWALRSLGEEIFSGGNGGGFPWLKEHLVDNYTPQWYQHFEDKPVDASIKSSSEMGRWYNYYIEGLVWLVENMDIDGLYLDDVSYDRRILKRMRRVMDEIKPGCLIDLHSNTGFSKGPATQYTEFFPFVDKLWFGESFMYNDMSPANWLVEVSGIPFGLMGDMLHGGGNPWRGMVYGMTVRYPWTTEGVYCDPMDIWKVWDNFGIADSKMVGYWENNPVVATTNKNVLATAYLKDNKMLVSIASWAKDSMDVKLKIDWLQTNYSKEKIKIYAPEIRGFQPERQFELDEAIPVGPEKGWLLYIERR